VTDRAGQSWPPVFPHIRYYAPNEAIPGSVAWFGFREQVRLAGPDGTVYVSELEGPAGAVSWWAACQPAYKEMIRALIPEFRDPAERPWPNLPHSTTVLIHDVDAHHERADAEGASILTAPQDQPWAIREYEALDLEGHHWQFGQQLRVVEPEEWGASRVDIDNVSE
jgi:uncharacterized glyoxalase superfamily protein PhnB